MMEERKIIQRIIDGDSNAYELLVQRYHVGLIIHCERLLGNRSDGEDIAQDTFVKAYQHLSSFDASKGRFSTWLYRIATNRALDELKKQKRQLQVEDIETVMEPIDIDGLTFDEKDAIMRALEALVPPEYRHVIESYFWHGKSYQEISAAMNIPVQTVGTWLHRAKTQLRKTLEESMV